MNCWIVSAWELHILSTDPYKWWHLLICTPRRVCRESTTPAREGGNRNGCLRLPRGGDGGKRTNVLVHMEEVFRIELCLDFRKPVVVCAIGGPDAFIAFVFHHEIHVG